MGVEVSAEYGPVSGSVSTSYSSESETGREITDLVSAALSMTQSETFEADCPA